MTSGGELHLVEHVVLRPGQIDRYLEALQRDYLPLTSGHGLELLEVLRSPEDTGEEELVLRWRVDGWAAYSAFRSDFQFGREPAASEWISLAESLRVGGRRRLMVRAF